MELPFVKGLKLAEGVGNAPTSAMPILFSGQVQPAYICLPSEMVRVERIALPSYSFRTRPSAAEEPRK